MAKNFFLDNDDLKLNLLYQKWDELFPLLETDPKDPEAIRNVDEAKVLYEEFLHSIGEYIAEAIDPKAHLLDEQQPTLKNGEMYDAPLMKEFKDGLAHMGAMALPFPRHVGGYNLPVLVSNMVCEMTARADVSLMTYYGFFSGIGLALLYLTIEEGNFKGSDKKINKTRFDTVMKDLALGKTSGAMCLTEPQAGSDLGQIQTKATKGSDGYWYLNGQKIWITCGHGEHHLVLARSENQKSHPGLKGLSLFYVPAHIKKGDEEIRNFEIAGQEKKMGQHSSVTVTINYDNSQAELLGSRGHGFRNMALVMNGARLLVGYEGLGLCEKVMRMARDFADERVTMGKKIKEHELIADYLDEMDVETKALRALAYKSGFDEETANRIKIYLKLQNNGNKSKNKLLKEKYKKYKWHARLATPLVKYFASENAVRFARMNMQIMGGAGYMKEYKAEKLMRDSLILPIYEGTSQIQALMVLKDHLQHAMRNPAKFVSKMASAKIATLSAKKPLDKQLAKLKWIYYASMQAIMTRMVKDKFGDLKGKPLTAWKGAFLKSWDPKKDFSFGLLNAERFCQITGRLWMARNLVKQLEVIKDEKLRNERIKLALKFMERSEPKMRGLLHEIEASVSSIFRTDFNKILKKNLKENEKILHS